VNTILKILTRGIEIKILYVLIFISFTISIFLLLKTSNIINNYHNLLKKSILGPFGVLELTIKNKDLKTTVKLLKKYDLMVYTEKNYEVKLTSSKQSQLKNVIIIVSDTNKNYLSPLLYHQFGNKIKLQINKKTKIIDFKYIQTGILTNMNIIFLSKKIAKYYNLPTKYNKISIRNISIDKINTIKNNIKNLLIKHTIAFKIKDLLKKYKNKKQLLKKMRNIQKNIQYIFIILITLFIFLVFITIFTMRNKSFINLLYLGINYSNILNTYIFVIFIIFCFSLFINLIINFNSYTQILIVIKTVIIIFILIYLILYFYLRKIS